VKHKLRICQEYKSEALADNKDLHVMQIPNLAKQFLVDTYLTADRGQYKIIAYVLAMLCHI
jgi:hypothetical protein